MPGVKSRPDKPGNVTWSFCRETKNPPSFRLTGYATVEESGHHPELSQVDLGD
jgi:hypothetical protein